jgi:hypothetical protein
MTRRVPAFDTAIGIGAMWLSLSILCELLYRTTELLGAATSPAPLRDLLMLSWLAAPLLFTRRTANHG